MNAAPSTGWRAWFAADPRRADLLAAAATVVVSAVLIGGSPEAPEVGWPEVVAGVGAFVLVLLRRRWPVPLLVVAVVWGTTHALVWERPSSMVFAVLVLLGTVCVRLDRGPAIALGTAVGLAIYGMALIVNDDLSPLDARALIGLVWAGAVVGIADAVRSWRRYRESVDAQAQAAIAAAEAEARQQVSEERLTIAREVHDLLSHSLSVMNVQTGAALHLLRTDPDQAEQALTAARGAGRTVLDELRELLSVLRGADTGSGAAVPDAPLEALPTVDDLPLLVETMRSSGLAVDWSQDGAPGELTASASLAAYRITQEALTNAAKHGDGAARLSTEWDRDTLTIIVTNPATRRRPESTSTGHGLVGMRERALANAGALDAGPVATGFTVRAQLPTLRDRPEAPS